MYLCPICKRQFETEDMMTKHSLKCWKEHNPNHKSKPAPRSENIEQITISESVQNFFASFNKENSQCTK